MHSPSSDLLRQKALALLAMRDYCSFDLKQKLTKYCDDLKLIESVLQELQEKGWQSDARFVASFIRYRAQKGYGPQRIRAELSQKQLDKHFIEEALEESEQNWTENAEKVRIKHFGAKAPADYKSQAKQQRFLQYRGFDIHTIHSLYRDTQYENE